MFAKTTTALAEATSSGGRLEAANVLVGTLAGGKVPAPDVMSLPSGAKDVLPKRPAARSCAGDTAGRRRQQGVQVCDGPRKRTRLRMAYLIQHGLWHGPVIPRPFYTQLFAAELNVV